MIRKHIELIIIVILMTLNLAVGLFNLCVVMAIPDSAWNLVASIFNFVVLCLLTKALLDELDANY